MTIDEARSKGYALALEECLIGEIVLAIALLAADGLSVAALHIDGLTAE